jgi:hypothetical protein
MHTLYNPENFKKIHRHRLCDACAKNLIDKGWLVLRSV